jgi:hypothetical protein
MNLGLGNLTELKAQLLSEVLRAGTEYDAPLQAIGSGVAAQFDQHCNRKLARAVADTVTFPADSPVYFLPRYPVEDVTAVATKDERGTTWSDVLADLYNWNAENGAIYFLVALGPNHSQLKITFTGGYWVDTSEDNSGTLPAGAVALPGDLKLAWFLQCEEVWNQKDKLGVGIIAETAKKPNFKSLELIPEVKDILRAHIRYQIT